MDIGAKRISEAGAREIPWSKRSRAPQGPRLGVHAAVGVLSLAGWVGTVAVSGSGRAPAPSVAMGDDALDARACDEFGGVEAVTYYDLSIPYVALAGAELPDFFLGVLMDRGGLLR